MCSPTPIPLPLSQMYWILANIGYDGDIYYTIVANGVIHFIM